MSHDAHAWVYKKIGAIFPILRGHDSNLFDKHQDVFVKFTKLKLKKGSTIVFYVTREKLLVGQARVHHVERLDPDSAWSRYEDRIFLNAEEYEKYVRISPTSMTRRKTSEITVFELDHVKKYEKSIKSIYPITQSGRYLTNEMIDRIRSLSTP